MTLSVGHGAVSFLEKIPSSVAEAEQLCLRIRDTLKTSHLSACCFQVELLARESLMNAVKHGNRNDSSKSIALELRVGREWIRLQVCDEGLGFAWRKATHDRMDENVSTGRGLHLYALYAERVQFNRPGNQVTFWIRKDELRVKGGCRMETFVIKQAKEQSSVKLTGDFTSAMIPKLQASLKEMLENGTRELAFDLASTQMLDSSGIGLLIAAANSLTARGGKLRVTNVCPDIFRLLQHMRLTSRLNVSGRVE
jgi:serine/threonine-protein kinase RsbW